jgi:hypothetical protein
MFAIGQTESQFTNIGDQYSSIQYAFDFPIRDGISRRLTPVFAKHFQTPKSPHTLRGGRINRGGRFCVPNGSLRGILLHDHHGIVTAGNQ